MSKFDDQVMYIGIKFETGMKKYGYLLLMLGTISCALLVPQLSKLLTSWVNFTNVLDGNIIGLAGMKAKFVFAFWVYLIGMVVLMWSQGFKYLQKERVG